MAVVELVGAVAVAVTNSFSTSLIQAIACERSGFFVWEICLRVATSTPERRRPVIPQQNRDREP